MGQMKMIGKDILLAALLTLVATGCGLGGQDPGSCTSGISNVTDTAQSVGIAECLSCHADGYNPSSLSNVVGDAPGGTGWLNGPHANTNAFPDYSSLADGAGGCEPCHDQLADGESMESLEAELSVDVGGINRPVVGCESCHGTGADHFGTAALQYAHPDASRCGQCHNENFSHTLYSPAGDAIYEKYSASAHAVSVDSTGISPEDMDALCGKCHTDEGARLYMTTPYSVLDAGYANITGGVTPVQCRTCHDPHNPLELRLATEYDTCTACHGLDSALHAQDSGYLWGDAGVDNTPGEGLFDPSEIIYDTHRDNPATPWIEGYVINAADAGACSGCHDTHSASVELNQQWARSAHGGFINTAKARGMANIADPDPLVAYANLLAVLNGTDPYGSVGAGDASFAQYNFIDQDGGKCRRCHTSTGFAYLAETGQEPYDLVNAPAFFGFSNSADEREMIYCRACHQSMSDDLRGDYVNHTLGVRDNSLLFNSISPYAEPAERIDAIASLGGSNVCMACHAGVRSGAQVKALPYPVSGGFDAYGPHDMAAGAILFRTAGFEPLPSAQYDNPVGFGHDKVGFSVDAASGDNGPCVGCHMKHSAGHTVSAVESLAGQIVDINAYDSTCSLCHGTQASDKATLVSLANEGRTGLEAALGELEAHLIANGVYYFGCAPYFYSSGVVDCAQDYATRAVDMYTPWAGPELLGAAFNYYLLRHEPGAYAHNSLYARRLIFDSLDALDGSLDGNAAIADAAAMSYLNAGVRP